jgi:hypothetical protein
MDFETEVIVKRWRDSNYNSSDPDKGLSYHKSAIEIIGTKLICLEDWDGIDILDYTAEGPSQIDGT